MNVLEESIDWYNSYTLQYDKQAEKYLPRAQINDFFTFLPSKDARIIDVGCGSGRDSHFFTQHGYRVTGVDLSKKLIELSLRKYPTISFIQADMRKLPFNNESFDGVWAHASLIHLQSLSDADAAIQEFSRVLYLNGIIHLLVKERTHETDQEIESIVDKRTGSVRTFHYYTQDEIKILTNQNGFAPIKMYRFIDRDSQKKYGKGASWIVYLGRKM